MQNKTIFWKDILSNERKKDYFKNILNILQQERKKYIIYPEKKNIFQAFIRTPLEHLKVVILGQDPYHSPDTAHGLSFSVKKNKRIPPSLRNIFIEIFDNYKINNLIKHGNLNNWAKQGILLLNSILTVRKGQPYSHANIGWDIFTNRVIKKISNNKKNIVYILWGNSSRKKKCLINKENNLILESSHPSPLSARKGFFGCKHFKKTNIYLKNNNIKEINWSV